jgi:quercetin dioxygenase-like cupin family protein
MRKEMFKANDLFRESKTPSSPSLLVFDMPTMAEKMKHEQNWIDGEINSIILLKTPTKQIVLSVLHEGTEIQSFQSNESITFQIIEGKMMFHTRKESVLLDKGQLITLHENIKYSLTTREDSVLLLTIATGAMQFSEN